MNIRSFHGVTEPGFLRPRVNISTSGQRLSESVPWCAASVSNRGAACSFIDHVSHFLYPLYLG
jgi:hypothetical protein